MNENEGVTIKVDSFPVALPSDRPITRSLTINLVGEPVLYEGRTVGRVVRTVPLHSGGIEVVCAFEKGEEIATRLAVTLTAGKKA